MCTSSLSRASVYPHLFVNPGRKESCVRAPPVRRDEARGAHASGALLVKLVAFTSVETSPDSRLGLVGWDLSMAIRASLVLLLLAVVVAPTLCEGREYKPCPTKGYYPKKANTTYTRCLAANELSCCQDCEDQYIMLRSISVNGTTLLDQFSPGLGEALGGKDLSVSTSESSSSPSSFTVLRILEKNSVHLSYLFPWL